jgi:SAM-dependent methyltransferase
MFSRTAALYDVIYGQFKDYVGETDRIVKLLRRVQPRAATVLDVACGTGEHARHLSRHGYRVDGLDLEPEFVRLARDKNPDGRFVVGDMVEFDLGRKYDGVLCLFSSIAYAGTLENVVRALECFRNHLAPGGVVLLEPWFEPAVWEEGRVFMHLAEGDGIKVCRMSHSRVVGTLSVLQFNYLIGRAEGIEHLTEIHELGLFTAAELAGCFEAAGLEVIEQDPEGLTGRGLFVSRVAGGRENGSKG